MEDLVRLFYVVVWMVMRVCQWMLRTVLREEFFERIERIGRMERIGIE